MHQPKIHEIILKNYLIDIATYKDIQRKARVAREYTNQMNLLYIGLINISHRCGVYTKYRLHVQMEPDYPISLKPYAKRMDTSTLPTDTNCNECQKERKRWYRENYFKRLEFQIVHHNHTIRLLFKVVKELFQYLYQVPLTDVKGSVIEDLPRTVTTELQHILKNTTILKMRGLSHSSQSRR